jgi:imidazolonepropionase
MPEVEREVVMGELLITGLGELATPLGRCALAGPAQGRIVRQRDAEVWCRDGAIVFAGAREDRLRLHGELPGVPRLDGRGGTLVPGFVDAHTHLPWAGTREEEFALRLAGTSYQEIAARGGGILSTVRATREAPEEQLAAAVVARLDQMLMHGTTTVEAKSGYGLALAPELKQLRAIARAAASHPVRVVPTLLAAHEVPPEWRGDRQRYVEIVCSEIVPAVAEAGLARFCDVFCEHGVFSVEESRQILLAGRRHGLAPRLHADEFADSGAAALAAEVGALSADHLMAVSPAGIAALAGSGTVATLLPGTSFFLLKDVWAPARTLVGEGVPVALATDCNPGSCFCESLPFVLTLAVFKLRLSIEEALVAATLNAAAALGLADEIGSIEVGKRADLVLLAAPNLLHLAYHLGVNPVAAVVKDGVVVHRALAGPRADTAGEAPAGSQPECSAAP